jgi:hypothetical protein
LGTAHFAVAIAVVVNRWWCFRMPMGVNTSIGYAVVVAQGGGDVNGMESHPPLQTRVVVGVVVEFDDAFEGVRGVR